jgi:hypothetical protein
VVEFEAIESLSRGRPIRATAIAAATMKATSRRLEASGRFVARPLLFCRPDD